MSNLSNTLQRYVTHSELDEWAYEQIPKMKKYAEKLIKINLPDYQHCLSMEPNKMHLDSFSLVPTTIQKEGSIGQTYVFPGWDLVKQFDDPFYADDPDYKDYKIDISTHESSFDAVRALVVASIEQRINNWHETEKPKE